MKASKRVRRTPAEAREVVLAAARGLLLDRGPQALTLQAVAAAVGMTHGNLTHHFGTSAGLQDALIADMAARLVREIEASVPAMRAGTAPPEAIVDQVHAALVEGGYGRLIAWLASSGRIAQLQPLFAVVAQVVEGLRAGEPEGIDGQAHGGGPIAYTLLVGALGESLIGPQLRAATGLGEAGTRQLAAGRLRALRAT